MSKSTQPILSVVALQEDIAFMLLSWDALSTVNVVQQRKMALWSEVDMATFFQTPRNGVSGMGAIVEMPSFVMDENTSAPGPQVDLNISVLVVEWPSVNVGPSGGNQDCESVAEMILAFLHQWYIENQGELYPDQAPIVPATDAPPGTRGYRVKLRLKHAITPFQRVTCPTMSIDGSFNVTLTPDPAQPVPQIYYTLDQTTPGPGNTNVGSVLQYTGPFPTVLGQVVRWAAFNPGQTPHYMPSAVGWGEIIST